jgi:hypothetical protein
MNDSLKHQKQPRLKPEMLIKRQTVIDNINRREEGLVDYPVPRINAHGFYSKDGESIF